MEDQWRYYAVYSPKQHIHTSYTTYTTYATFASGLAMAHAMPFYLRASDENVVDASFPEATGGGGVGGVSGVSGVSGVFLEKEVFHGEIAQGGLCQMACKGAVKGVPGRGQGRARAVASTCKGLLLARALVGALAEKARKDSARGRRSR